LHLFTLGALILKINMANTPKSRVQQIGGDGLWTFLLSNLIITLTLGLTACPAFFYVVLLAIKTTDKTSCKTILVLGERLRNSAPGHNFIARLERAYTIFSANKIQHIYIVGGVTGKSSISESACGKSFLLNKQVPENILYTEDKSQHTLENLKNVRSMFADQQISSIGIITNRFHLARASVLATGLDMTHELCAAEGCFKNTAKQWLLMIREAYFIHWYFTGKYWSILTRNNASLGRIR
jgi:uncharacterized SAM-binding protein YcdF (DUF218 family)